MAQAICRGHLGLHKRKGTEVRFFELYSDRLEYYRNQEDADAGAEPRGRLALHDVTHLEVLDGGILAMHLPGQVLQLVVQEGEDRDVWIRGLKGVGVNVQGDDDGEIAVQPTMRPEGSKGVRARSEAACKGEGGEPAHEEHAGVASDARKPIYEGVVEIVRKKKLGEPRYFVLYADHVEYFNDARGFHQGAQSRGKLSIKDISSLEVNTDDCTITVVVSGRAFQLRMETPEDTRRWGEAWAEACWRGGNEEADVTLVGDKPNVDSVGMSPTQTSRLEMACKASQLKRATTNVSSPATKTNSSGQSYGLQQGTYSELGDLMGEDGDLADEARGALGYAVSRLGNASTGDEGEDAGRSRPSSGWVRPSTAALQQASFKLVRDDGTTSHIYMELFPTQLVYHRSAPGVRPDSTAAPPEGVVPLSDLADLEAREDGMVIKLENGSKLNLMGPDQGSLEDWLVALSRLFDVEELEEEEEEDAASARPSAATPPAPLPARQLAPVAKVKSGARATIQPTLRARSSTSSTPGAEAPTVRPPPPVRPSSAAASARWAQNATAPAPVRTRTVGSSNLHEGPLKLINAAAGTQVKAIMTASKLQLMPTSEKGPALVSIELEDVQEVRVADDSFEVTTAGGDVHVLQAPNKPAFKTWVKVWEGLLSRPLKLRAQTFELARAKTFDMNARQDTIVRRADLDVERGGEVTRRHFVIYADRFACYTSARAADDAPASPLYEILPVEVRTVRVHDEGIEIGLDDENVDLRLGRDNDLEGWIDALRTCFSRRHQPRAATQAGEDGVLDERLLLDSPEPHPEGSPEASQASAKLAKWPRAGKVPEVPPSADPRALAQTCITRVDPLGKPTCQGMLGFQDHGRMVMRYAILYPNRLDCWNSVEDVLHLHTPKSSLKLSDVLGMEILAGGFLLIVKEPMKRKLGIHASHPDDLRCWTDKLLQALHCSKEVAPLAAVPRNWVPHCRVGEPPAPEAPSRRASMSAPAGARPGSPRQKAAPGFVPRCALLPPKEHKPPAADGGYHLFLSRPAMNLHVHVPPDSHAGGRGVLINTHKEGGIAHSNISRQGLPQDTIIAPLSASQGTTSPRLQPTAHLMADLRADRPPGFITEKVPAHVATIRLRPEDKMGDKVTGQRVVSPRAPPGEVTWQKITQRFDFVPKVASPPVQADQGSCWQKIGHLNGQPCSPRANDFKLFTRGWEGAIGQAQA